MGLLGNMDDPSTQGLLTLGMGLLNSQGSIGQALGQAGPVALNQMLQARQLQKQEELAKKQRAYQEQVQAIQLQQIQAQLAEQQQQAADRARQREFLQNLQTPGQQAMAGGGGPSVANAAKIDPMQEQLFGALKAGALPYSAYLQMQQKDETPVIVPEGGKAITRSGKVLALGNPKASDVPAQIREYEYARQQGYQGSFDQWTKEQKRAGATNVSVSMDKGFGDAFAKSAAEMLASSRDQAKAAATTIQTLNNVDSILSSGRVAVGPTAKFETFGRQLGELTGLAGKDNAETLANTRRLMQSASALALDGAAAMKGQGQITEAERQLIANAAGGNVDSMTVPEIRALTGALRKVNAAKIKAHQAQLQNVGPQFKAFTPFYQVEPPADTIAPVAPDMGGWSIKPKGQ